MATWRAVRAGLLLPVRLLLVLLLPVLLLPVLPGWMPAGGTACAQEAPPADGAVRTWTDISGKFSREAEFLKLEEGMVHLRLASGKETKIPLKELSKKDRDWVRANVAAGTGGSAGGATGKGIATRVVVKSYKTLLDDSIQLSKSLKQPALAGALPGVFVALTGGKPLEGFDIKRPIVITFHVDGKGEPLGAMVAVPVEGKEKFQKTLDAVFPPKTSPKGKAYEIPMLGKSVYAKPGERYFLLSDVPALVAAAKADPPDPVAVADVAIESLLDAVPEELRAAALAQFESGFDASMAGVPRDPTTPPAQAEAERRSQEATAAWVKKTVRSITTDGDRSTVEVNLDPETKRVSLAVSVRARPGTALAEGFASYGAIRPGFAAAGDADALAWVGVSSPTGEWLKMALGLIFESGIEGMKSAAADAAARGGAAIPPQGQAVLDGIEKASRKMMATPNLEVEVMVAADGAGKPRIVSRTTAEGATDLFAALAKIGGLDPAGPSPPDADGVMAMPVPPGAPPSMGLLDVPVRVASGGSSVVMGFGCADNAPVKKLLTAPGTAASAAPVSAWVDVAKLWPIVVANDPGGLLSDTADAVGGEGMFRLDLGALKDGIELRLNVDDGVLQLLGRVAEKMAAPPGGAGGPGGLPGRPGGFPGQPGGFPGGFPGPTP